MAGAVRRTSRLAMSVACRLRWRRRERCGRRCVGRRRARAAACALLLQGAWAASLHPAEGTGLRRLQVPTVLSVVAGARTRRSTRPSARVHRSAPVYAWGLFVPAVEAASVRARRASQGRAVWPARSSAARRCRQVRAYPRARPQLRHHTPSTSSFKALIWRRRRSPPGRQRSDEAHEEGFW